MRPNKYTPEKREAFLEALRETGTVYHAAKVVGVCRKTVYQWRDRYPKFAKAWDDCLEDVADTLEASMFQRAMGGDTTAGIFMLKAFRPEKYRERIQQQLTGPNGGPIEITAIRQGVQALIRDPEASNMALRLSERMQADETPVTVKQLPGPNGNGRRNGRGTQTT